MAATIVGSARVSIEPSSPGRARKRRCGSRPSTLIAAAEDRGDVHLFRVNLEGTMPERIVEGRQVVHGYDLARGGQGEPVLATVRSEVAHGGELWVKRNDTDVQVTRISSIRLGWDKFTVSCIDGSDEIDVWVMVPPDHDQSGSHPVLLNVHGGPFTQYGESYFDEAQMQAAAGFMVVMTNPRGSSGRHAAWGQAILGPKHPQHPGTGWGSVDVDDVIAALDGALARYPSADPSRVGMLGGKLRRVHGDDARCSLWRTVPGSLFGTGGQQLAHRGTLGRHCDVLPSNPRAQRSGGPR